MHLSGNIPHFTYWILWPLGDHVVGWFDGWVDELTYKLNYSFVYFWA